jgi:A118 family predicted phage portal protein
MFQRILSWIRERLNKMLNPSSVKSALRLDTAITPLMAEALQKWSLMYVNNSPWLNTEIKSLNLAASIAAEIARAVTIEMDVAISGSPRADFLAEQMISVVNSLRLHTEYGAAKGGIVFKPYIHGDMVIVDFVQADMFFPIAFDANGNMTSCVFADQKTIGRDFYTRLEYHAMLPEGYRITNTAFRSTVRDMLGSEVSLSSVDAWAELQPEAVIVNIDKPLFAYFKMPFANNIDPTSPLGVSVYARAVNLIEQADRQWSDFLWEFESGKRALYTDPMAFQKDTSGKPILPDRRLYRLLELNSKVDQPGLFEDWTPTLREVNILNGLDAILRRIEFACGLSYGTLSNPEAVALTATEIKSSRQRYYMTVTDTQKSL